METFEAPWVGILMDIAKERHSMELAAKQRKQRWYGEGNIDELSNPDIPYYSQLLEMSAQQFERKPTSWSRFLCFVTNNCVLSSSPELLRANLVDLAALCTAWIQDLDNRDDINASR